MGVIAADNVLEFQKLRSKAAKSKTLTKGFTKKYTTWVTENEKKIVAHIKKLVT